MNKQQLAQKIWASANQMRSKIEANEYKDYILGFIFYKYLSDKEVKFLKENDYDDELLKTVSEEDDETVKWVQENIGYFIAYKDLFSTWLSMGKDFDVSNVRDALSAFSRLISNTHKKVFDKVFDTLQTGLSKLGDSSGSQTKAISGLLTLIKDIQRTKSFLTPRRQIVFRMMRLRPLMLLRTIPSGKSVWSNWPICCCRTRPTTARQAYFSPKTGAR